MPAVSQDRTSSFAAVYRAQFGFVWRTLRALGVAEGSVDDALQDVFLVVHRRLPGFEPRAPISAWLYEITRRIAYRYRTRAARDATRTCEFSELPAGGDLDRDLDRSRAATVMRDFLWRLDEDRRRAFVLSEFSGMPGREIAEVLGVNMNTIYARVRSARIELDRTAKRMRAQDSAAVVRVLRRERPPTETERRTWAAVIATVGGSARIGAEVGILAWAAGGLCAGAVVLASWAALPSAPGVESVPTLPHAPTVESAPAVAAAGTPAPPLAPAPVPERGRSVVEVPASRAEPRDARVRVGHSPTPQPSLAEELRLVRAIRGSIKAGRYGVAQSKVSAYRADFVRGALRQEVEALEVELACRTHAPNAAARVEGLRHRRIDEGLLERLKIVCGERISPQKPEPTEIHTR
ncbi:MAG: RNA polymerase sigma factor [Nannocystales bacterium]